MIRRLNHTNPHVAKDIRAIFQASYKIEAALLKAVDFPPLKRPLERFLSTPTQFFGYLREETLAGVIEIESLPNATSINSLVVHPDFFRQGIGKALMEYTLVHFRTPRFVVETGVDNGPATTLYRKLGFTEVRQWDTDHGVRKVQFELVGQDLA